MEKNVSKDLMNRQYAAEDPVGKIERALIKAGKQEDGLNMSDLSSMDEIHVGGRGATARLARIVDLPTGAETLDIGSGLGGPARFLAAKYGCRVTGLDITEDFCRAAGMLTRRLGLSREVNFVNADALQTPFKDNSYDAVWCQHCLMNIKDKEKLFSEFRRILRKEGVLALHEVTAGSRPPLFPVPWANDSSISFLSAAAETQLKLINAGFKMIYWKDISQEALGWYKKLKDAIKREGIPPLNQKLIFGDSLRQIGYNMRKNLMDKRIHIIQAVLKTTKHQ